MNKKNCIKVVGAREHNLKNVSVDIPKNSLTIITGPSGSGKSTLALDILYTEGKRRYIESLSSYARQFLGLPKKPDVDRIDGLCPAIAIDQKTVGSNPRSTVGTITEIYDYLRVLFSRIGNLHCSNCSSEVKAEYPENIANLIVSNFKNNLVLISAPIAIYKKGEFLNELKELFNQGYYRFIVDNKRFSFRNIDEINSLKLKKTERHNIDVLIDACEAKKDELARFVDAIEKSFKIANNVCKVILGNKEYLYASERMCLKCGISFDSVEPRLFSFNSPIGACQNCHGLGFVYNRDLEYDRWSDNNELECNECSGKRLNKTALSVFIDGKNIFELCNLPINSLFKFFKNLKLSDHNKKISERLVQEITSRLKFLTDVGLSYLTLNRTAKTLSGGESQRIRLATQIGSALSGVLYILDEPSIGLHQRDNDRLIQTLQRLRDLGNTLIVVEHDTDTMMSSDYIIDMGPAAGALGGQVVSVGSPSKVSKDSNSLTGAYLSNRKSIIPPKKLRNSKKFIELKNAKQNNLKDVSVKFPLNVFCCVSGVSGSGKSTLIMQELVPSLNNLIKRKNKTPEWMKLLFKNKNKIEGYESLENLVVIDQSPIGRTSRSTPATYLGIFNEIRKIFASLPESNLRGYKPGRFSFNVDEGRCSKCSGDGIVQISMHFLADVILTCNECNGTRYNKQTLEILFKGKNIFQVLDMTAQEAYKFFKAHTNLAKKLKFMCDVGLDYVKLGQSSTTLSGGEAQRIKLSSELSKRGVNTLYILDEPTTGLHSSDIEKLLKVLQTLIDKGNSILVIEHNVDVLKSADYIIDLGPEGGDQGGQIVAYGTPAEISKNKSSHTGKYLKKVLSV